VFGGRLKSNFMGRFKTTTTTESGGQTCGGGLEVLEDTEITISAFDLSLSRREVLYYHCTCLIDKYITRSFSRFSSP
jgi:hypothetical protein